MSNNSTYLTIRTSNTYLSGLMFNTMFERATVFSATLLFVLLGVVGIKYFKFLDAKDRATQSSNIQFLIPNI